jgi:hypothetical protein
MSETLGDTVEGGLDVANESWFKHDTGGTITAVDDLEDWVKRNLDLSLAPNCKIVDIYNDDMPSIFVGIQGPENEIEELKRWEPSIWEFKLNPNYVNRIGSSTYEFVFALPDYIDVNPDGFGRNDNEPMEESKEPAENKLEENKMKEAAARVQCADELKALVSRFVAGFSSIDLKGETYEEKYGNRINDLAELMIKEAQWVGFPTEALKYLPWIVNQNCLCLGPIELGEFCNVIERKLHEMKESTEPADNKLEEGRIPKDINVPDPLDCVLMMCGALKGVGNWHIGLNGGGSSEFESIDNNEDLAIQFLEERGDINAARICGLRTIAYKVYLNTGREIQWVAQRPDLDDFKSYSKEEFKRDLAAVVDDLRDYKEI